MSRLESATAGDADNDRQAWMAVLAKALPADLEEAHGALETAPVFDWVRPPETGLVMVRGRAGGTGDAFNLGEMTVTRCALRIASGETGVAYVQGRSKRRAELAALFDAMLQNPAHTKSLRVAVIDKLADRHARQRAAESRKVKATQVDFFTMVRGEDPKP